MSIYDDDALVLKLTLQVMRQSGSRIFQIHKLAPTDEAHVERLLELLDPPPRAEVADLGCGVGGVAELMQYRRPDLTFTLVNISRNQLELCPKWMKRIEGRMADLPLGTQSFDAAMIGYALGHTPLAPTMREAARILRPGGVLLVYDLFAEVPYPLEVTLGYSPPQLSQLVVAAERAGFHVEAADHIPTREHMRGFLACEPPAAALAAVADAYTAWGRFIRC